MSQKTSAEVLIGGKVYTLSGYESEEYLQRVAAYITGKINEYESMEMFRRLPTDMRYTLIELNIADDYFKARTQVEKLEQNLELRERELYSLKHNLVTNQIQTESDEKSIRELEEKCKDMEKKVLEKDTQNKELEKRLKELEAQNKELLLNKSKLESSLEDALLGKKSEKKK